MIWTFGIGSWGLNVMVGSRWAMEYDAVIRVMVILDWRWRGKRRRRTLGRYQTGVERATGVPMRWRVGWNPYVRPLW